MPEPMPPNRPRMSPRETALAFMLTASRVAEMIEKGRIAAAEVHFAAPDHIEMRLAAVEGGQLDDVVEGEAGLLTLVGLADTPLAGTITKVG
jgi:hypothetical protein